MWAQLSLCEVAGFEVFQVVEQFCSLVLVVEASGFFRVLLSEVGLQFHSVYIIHFLTL